MRKLLAGRPSGTAPAHHVNRRPVEGPERIGNGGPDEESFNFLAEGREVLRCRKRQSGYGNNGSSFNPNLKRKQGPRKTDAADASPSWRNLPNMQPMDGWSAPSGYLGSMLISESIVKSR